MMQNYFSISNKSTTSFFWTYMFSVHSVIYIVYFKDVLILNTIYTLYAPSFTKNVNKKTWNLMLQCTVSVHV